MFTVCMVNMVIGKTTFNRLPDAAVGVLNNGEEVAII